MRLRGSHNSENLCEVLQRVLASYRLSNSLGFITADNVSVNSKIFSNLEKHIPWIKRDGHIRCMPHVINVVAQKLFTTLKAEANEAETHLADA